MYGSMPSKNLWARKNESQRLKILHESGNQIKTRDFCRGHRAADAVDRVDGAHFLAADGRIAGTSRGAAVEEF